MKLTKQQIKERDAAREKHLAAYTKLETAYSAYIAAVEEAADAYDQAVERAREPLNAEIDAYNEVVEDANDVLMGVHSQLEEQLTDKSETWLESDAGERAASWVSEWDDWNHVETLDQEETSVETPASPTFVLPTCEENALYAVDSDKEQL
jgi:cell fate (sporulation/competence/biofilm development) regulator YmcA (YheA/YmcA/DUF963 family)